MPKKIRPIKRVSLTGERWVETVKYPFIIREISFMHPDLICMVCGYHDTKPVFNPPRKKITKITHRSGTSTIDIKLPLPGSRNHFVVRCPMCLVTNERSLGMKIWNLL